MRPLLTLYFIVDIYLQTFRHPFEIEKQSLLFERNVGSPKDRIQINMKNNHKRVFGTFLYIHETMVDFWLIQCNITEIDILFKCQISYTIFNGTTRIFPSAYGHNVSTRFSCTIKRMPKGIRLNFLFVLYKVIYFKTNITGKRNLLHNLY